MKAQPKQRSHLDFSAYGDFFWNALREEFLRMDKYNKYCSTQYLLLLKITKCHAFLSLTGVSTVLLWGPN